MARACRASGARVETRVLDLADVPALLAWTQGVAEGVDLAVVNAGITSNVRDEIGRAHV